MHKAGHGEILTSPTSLSLILTTLDHEVEKKKKKRPISETPEIVQYPSPVLARNLASLGYLGLTDS